MRIDDENKVVVPTIPEYVATWVEKNNEPYWNDEYTLEDALNDSIHFTIYGLWANYPETNSDTKLRVPVLEWLDDDRGNYFKLVDAVRYEYEIEVEQKYYWRKKKEYLAWFEDVNFRYLNNHKPTESTLLTNIDNLKSFTVKFTEQEARDLLKDDFDKFEKVECE